MNNTTSHYAVYSIVGLPAGLWGESYVIATSYERSQDQLVAEYFILTNRPHEAMNSGSVTIAVSPIPPDLGTIDLEFALQEGQEQAKLRLYDLLEARATELGRPDLAYLQFDIKPSRTGHLLGCWMRGQFNAQLSEIGQATQCPSLKRYLSLLSQVSVIRRAG
jgi:hypothetical protein